MFKSSCYTFSRRRLLADFSVGAAALPLLSWVPLAHAQDLPHLSPDDPAAKTLAYTETANTIDAKSEMMFKSGSHCANCTFFHTAEAKGDYAPCTIFPGRVVNKDGWCRAWAPKA